MAAITKRTPAHRVAMIDALSLLMSGKQTQAKQKLKEAQVLVDKFYKNSKSCS